MAKTKQPTLSGLWERVRGLEARIQTLEAANVPLDRSALQAVVDSINARPHETFAVKPGALVSSYRVTKVRRKPTRECTECGERYEPAGKRGTVCPGCR